MNSNAHSLNKLVNDYLGWRLLSLLVGSHAQQMVTVDALYARLADTPPSEIDAAIDRLHGHHMISTLRRLVDGQDIRYVWRTGLKRYTFHDVRRGVNPLPLQDALAAHRSLQPLASTTLILPAQEPVMTRITTPAIVRPGTVADDPAMLPDSATLHPGYVAPASGPAMPPDSATLHPGYVAPASGPAMPPDSATLHPGYVAPGYVAPGTVAGAPAAPAPAIAAPSSLPHRTVRHRTVRHRTVRQRIADLMADGEERCKEQAFALMQGTTLGVMDVEMRNMALSGQLRVVKRKRGRVWCNYYTLASTLTRTPPAAAAAVGKPHLEDTEIYSGEEGGAEVVAPGSGPAMRPDSGPAMRPDSGPAMLPDSGPAMLPDSATPHPGYVASISFAAYDTGALEITVNYDSVIAQLVKFITRVAA